MLEEIGVSVLLFWVTEFTLQFSALISWTPYIYRNTLSSTERVVFILTAVKTQNFYKNLILRSHSTQVPQI